jgi:hypothetical protein
MMPDGKTREVIPSELGAINHAHTVRLDPSDRDAEINVNYEHQFQSGDDNANRVMEALVRLSRPEITTILNDEPRFLPQNDDAVDQSALMELLISLCIRSPLFRSRCSALGEHLRGPLDRNEREGLASANQIRAMRMIREGVADRGKIAVLYSLNREFIFADGFAHNYHVPTGGSFAGRFMLVPLLPTIAVLHYLPQRYLEQPRLFTTTLKREEVDNVNAFTQTYAKRFLFYRNEQPRITPSFKQGEHLEVSDYPHPIVKFASGIPGIRHSHFGSPLV